MYTVQLLMTNVNSGVCCIFLKVNFPIIVTQLGVFDSNSDGIKSHLTARLYDKISQVGANYQLFLYKVVH